MRTNCFASLANGFDLTGPTRLSDETTEPRLPIAVGRLATETRSDADSGTRISALGVSGRPEYPAGDCSIGGDAKGLRPYGLE